MHFAYHASFAYRVSCLGPVLTVASTVDLVQADAPVQYKSKSQKKDGDY